MAEESAPSGVEIPVPRNMDEVNVLLGRKSEALQEIQIAQGDYDKVVSVLNEIKLRVLDPRSEEIQAIDAACAAYLVPNRTRIKTRYGKTINLQNGVIKFFTRDASTDLPKDETPIVQYILGEGEGKDLITWTPTLNKKALPFARKELLLQLRRRFGVWIGRHEHITSKVEGEKSPTTLGRRRFAERPLRK